MRSKNQDARAKNQDFFDCLIPGTLLILGLRFLVLGS